jgi:hypothetical protein
MSTLSPSEQQDLRTVVEALYSKHMTAHWEMNEALLGVVTELLKESKICSEAFDLVPRPGVYLNPDDVRKELQRMAKRVLQGGGLNYLYCINVASLKFKQTADMAGQGAVP